MEAGDLLFYTHEDWASRLIQRATNGPFSHVEIAVNGTESVGALGRGITRHTASTPTQIAAVGKLLEADRLSYALNWLEALVGARYGWLDILADAVQLVLPGTPFLVAPSQFDCSDLATRFLLAAGYKFLPRSFLSDPSHVSPNDLARALELIK